MRGYVNNRQFGGEAGTDESVAAIRAEHGHARAVGHLDAAGFLHLDRVDDRDVIFAAHRHPQFVSVRREKYFMRRTANVNNSLHFVRGRVYQRYRIRSYRNDGERLRIWRVAQAVHQKLANVERLQSGWHRLAEPNHAEQLVAGWIDHGDGVRGLVCRVNAVVSGDGNVGTAPGRLLRGRAWQQKE